jgi:hypothetical protein
MSDTRLVAAALHEYAAGDRRTAEHRLAVCEDIGRSMAALHWEAKVCHALALDYKKPGNDLCTLLNAKDETMAFLELAAAMLVVLGLSLDREKAPASVTEPAEAS